MMRLSKPSEWADRVRQLMERRGWIERRRLEVKGSLKKQWNLIRDIYREIEPEIIEATQEGQFTNPYILPWRFTPIEQNVWNDIRPNVPLYPQYPVLNYFVDFANPYFRVGVEVDGREYHQDKEKDLKRDRRLFDEGWVIYRIPGYKTFPNYPHPKDEDFAAETEADFEEYQNTVRDWYVNNSEGIIRAIAQEHFSDTFPFPADWDHIDAVIETLEEHISIGQGCSKLRVML